MIRIEKPAAPAVLLTRGADAARALCELYDAGTRAFDFDDGIYNHKTVRAELVKAQHGKCAFCESKVTHVYTGDIEHYRPKGASQQRKGARSARRGITGSRTNGRTCTSLAAGAIRLTSGTCSRSATGARAPLRTKAT